MKTYGQLDLKKIMDAENLDFARWTYGRGQCSCCYGPLDMPAKYWKGKKKPIERKIGKQMTKYFLGDEPFDQEKMRYILFKNAFNGSGIVTADETIAGNVCIEYQLDDMEQVRRICSMLRDQLDEDYVVVEPDDMNTCIIISGIDG